MSAYIIEFFLPTLVIEGRHFPSEKEIVLQQVSIRLSHLSEWLQSTGREISLVETDKGMGTLTLVHRQPEGITVSYGSGHLQLGLDSKIRYARFGGDFVVSEDACISIIPREPLGLDEFLEECLPPIVEFVAVGVGRPVSIRELRAKTGGDYREKTEDEQREVPSVQLFWKKKRYKGEDKELFLHDMVFTCPQLGDRLEENLTEWVRLYHAIKPVMQLFFGRVMTAETISPNSFLNAVQAAEAYHRHRRGGTELPEVEHKDRMRIIRDAVPEEYRKWLNAKLCLSNEKGLVQRLRELLEERMDLLGISPEHIGSIAKRAKDLRNSFTHYMAKKEFPFGTEHDFYYLGTLMQWILIACFLEEMGLTRTRAHELLGQCEPFRYFRGAHLKTLQVESPRVESDATPEEGGP